VTERQRVKSEEMNMSKKALYIRHKAKPGKREEVKRIWETYARPYVEAADGQLVYVYGFDDQDPDVIVAYQLMTDASGADEFIKQPWYGDYERETAALLAGPSEFRTITPQWIKDEPA
jgi:quinol monooxygenase YgiN